MNASAEKVDRPGFAGMLPPAGDLFRWWGRELAAMTPRWLRRLFSPDHQIIAIDLETGEAVWFASLDHVADHAADQPALLGRLPLAEGDEAMRSQLRSMLRDKPSGRRALALALPEALTRNVTLPAAAGRNLEAVLRLDMDRQTPFPGTAVRFVHRRLSGGTAGDGIKVALTFAPRDACERAEKLAAALGVELAYLGGRTSPPWEDNLHQNRGGWRRWVVRALVVFLLLLLTAAVWLPLERDRRLAAAARTDVEALQARHEMLLAQQADLAGLVLAADAAAGSSPEALPILSAVAKALPENGRIDRLAWRDGEVVMSGRTGASAELVSALGAVPTFERVAYRSPVTRDGVDERFHLSFEVSQPAETGDESETDDESGAGEESDIGGPEFER